MSIIPDNQKILTSAPEVKTVYGGPQSLKSLNTWYTMEDIKYTVRPYKVYTALLTQSGGGEEIQLYSGDLIIGVTYWITDGGGDFTNVGATNNDVGTYFVATGTTPNDWGVGGLRYNTGAPVVTVLENTIGNIWFDFNNDGFYRVKSNDLFVSDKTFVLIGTRDTNTANSPGNNYMFVSDSTTIIIDTQDLSGTLMNGNLYNTPIEIRVYN